jgi:gpW
MRFNPAGTILAGISQATLQANLTAAQTAYNQLMIGGMAVSVAYEGKSVTYLPGQEGRLAEYINMLQRQLGNCSAGRRALRPYFR